MKEKIAIDTLYKLINDLKYKILNPIDGYFSINETIISADLENGINREIVIQRLYDNKYFIIEYNDLNMLNYKQAFFDMIEVFPKEKTVIVYEKQNNSVENKFKYIPEPPKPPADRRLREGQEPPKPKNYND